ncbi:magnesium transporter MRS2-5 isoform X1 [Tanacetum coccineum]
MNDDGDMAEISTSGTHKLQRAFNNDKHGSLVSSSVTGETDNIDQLEMLLEAYFVGINNTLNKLLSGFSDSNDSVNLQTMRFKDRTVPPRLLGFRCSIHHLNQNEINQKEESICMAVSTAVDNYELNAAKSGS